MNSFHFPGDRERSQFPMNTTPKKIAKSIVGKSIGTPRSGLRGAAGCRIYGRRQNQRTPSEQVFHDDSLGFSGDSFSLVDSRASTEAPGGNCVEVFSGAVTIASDCFFARRQACGIRSVVGQN